MNFKKKTIASVNIKVFHWNEGGESRFFFLSLSFLNVGYMHTCKKLNCICLSHLAIYIARTQTHLPLNVPCSNEISPFTDLKQLLKEENVSHFAIAIVSSALSLSRVIRSFPSLQTPFILKKWFHFIIASHNHQSWAIVIHSFKPFLCHSLQNHGESWKVLKNFTPTSLLAPFFCSSNGGIWFSMACWLECNIYIWASI